MLRLFLSGIRGETHGITTAEKRSSRELLYDIKWIVASVYDSVNLEILADILKVYIQKQEVCFGHIPRWRGFPFLQKSKRPSERTLRIHYVFDCKRLIGVFCNEIENEKTKGRVKPCRLNRSILYDYLKL
jgi:hypothetical protein